MFLKFRTDERFDCCCETAGQEYTVEKNLCPLSVPSIRSLKIVSLNINGGRGRQKRALIFMVSDQKKIDMMVLQETHESY